MLHAPPLLFLDEPFEGLDPLTTRVLRTMLELLRSRGVTLFLTSHVMPLVERSATHVAILDEGRVLRSGELDAVIGEHDTLEAALVETLGSRAPAPALTWYRP